MFLKKIEAFFQRGKVAVITDHDNGRVIANVATKCQWGKWTSKAFGRHVELKENGRTNVPQYTWDWA